MRVLIVEDEASVAARLKRMITQIIDGKAPVIHAVSTFEQATLFINENCIDLLLLDLNLNGQDGFNLLKQAVAGSFHTIIISAYQEKAIEAFEYGVLDFVAKPFTYDRLNKAIDRLEQKRPTGTAAKYLAVKKQGHIELVDPTSIKYIKASGDYTYLYLAENARVLHDKSLENLEMILFPLFLRIHKSYLVRVGAIKSLHITRGSRYEAELDNGDFIPVGRTKFKILKEALLI